MKTLYLRNVPDDVVSRLQQLAERDGTSVSVLAVRELSLVSKRADHPDLVYALPDLAVDVSDLVRGIDEDRSTR